MDKRKKRLIAIALCAAALILAVFGIIALPDDIVIQIAAGGGTNKGSKYMLAVPFGITVVFSYLFAAGDDATTEKKHIMGAVLGLVLFLITIGINL